MPAITVDNISKKYRKGQVGYRTLREDLYNLTGQLIHLRRGNRNYYEGRYIWALKDFSFQVDKGETLGIIGPNGAGKTTTLRLLAGITRPTQGNILVNGRMGVLIELQAGFHPELTGRENIFLNGAILGMTRQEIKRKLDDIVDFADIEGFIDTPIKRYSSGMMVRLGFSVAVHVNPDILLVDEVLAVGDVAFQAKCFAKMGELIGKGCALVFVSHNMVVMQRMCRRVIWLQKGRIREDGEAVEVCNSYSNHMISSSGDEAVSTGVAVDHAAHNISLKSVEVHGKSSEQVNEVLAGEDCTIRVVFEAGQRLVKPAFQIGIKRADGLELAILHSKAQGDSIDFEGTGTVKCRIPNLPLLPGVYSLRVAILAGDRPGTLLSAENTVQLRVLSSKPGDLLTCALILPEHEWDYE